MIQGHTDPNTCIHSDGKGLCLDCELEFQCDPAAWFEYGEHTEGILRWEALKAEMAADAEEFAVTAGNPADYWEGVPF